MLPSKMIALDARVTEGMRATFAARLET